MSFFLIFKLFKLGNKQVQKRRHPERFQQHQVWYENGQSEMAYGSSDNRGGNGLNRPPATPKYVLNTALRFLQFVLGWTVVGLYGVDLHHAVQKGAYADSKWVYAEYTSGMSVITSTMHLLSLWCLERRRGKPGITSYSVGHLPFFVWEVLMCIFWLVLFGIFGAMYIGEDAEGQDGIVRMKHAVWVDLVSLVLWCATATWSGLRWWKSRSQQGQEFPEKVAVENIGYPQPPATADPVYYANARAVGGDEAEKRSMSPVASGYPRSDSPVSDLSRATTRAR